MKRTARNVNDYIARFPKESQQMMRIIRKAIREAAPKAKELISYQMPFYEYKRPGYIGRLAYFGAFTNHVSVFAWGKQVDKIKGLKKYRTSKSALQFPIGTKIPATLIKKAVRARMKEIDAKLAKQK